MGSNLGLLVVLLCVCSVFAGDMLRKSIVFDLATPNVFYCPLAKPTSFDNMLVKARPLKALCEFGGKGSLPKSYKSDCYNDVDETEFACTEKKRIMMRINPPNETEAIFSNQV